MMVRARPVLPAGDARTASSSCCCAAERPARGRRGRRRGLRRAGRRAAVDHARAGLDPRQRDRHLTPHQDAGPGRRTRADADILVAAAGVPAPDHRRHDQAGRHRDRRRRASHGRRARRRRGFDEAVEVAGAITPVPGGVGPDDGRDAAGQHRAGRRGRRRSSQDDHRDRRPSGRRSSPAAQFAVTGEIVPPRSAGRRRDHASTRVALVGYVDAANVTDNPTASRAHVAGGGRGGRRGRRASSRRCS